jgi:hypothetical protein
MSPKRRPLSAVIVLALFLSACGGSGVSHAPPAANRDLLAGKWQAREQEQLFQSFEFKDDKSFQVTLWQLPEPITGTYSWSGDNTITLEYKLSEETKKAGKETLAAYRQHIKDRAKAGGGQYAEQIANSSANYEDGLLDKQDWRIGLFPGAHEEMNLKSNKGLEFTFKRPN